MPIVACRCQSATLHLQIQQNARFEDEIYKDSVERDSSCARRSYVICIGGSDDQMQDNTNQGVQVPEPKTRFKHAPGDTLINQSNVLKTRNSCLL